MSNDSHVYIFAVLPQRHEYYSDYYPQGHVVDLYGVRHPAGMAERALFIIDKEGVIRSIEVMYSPGEMPDNVDLFDTLRQLA